METFTDYYAILDVDVQASAGSIKIAFKRLALQYHPDVYKGADAQERMRTLLLAYQTLSDPAERKAYDARRSEHVLGTSGERGHVDAGLQGIHRSARPAEASPEARRDRQRSYAFPDLGEPRALHLALGDMDYELTANEAFLLLQDGMLRGVSLEAPARDVAAPRHCHRCHHRWTPGRLSLPGLDDSCPACQARDWGEYLLLRCARCHAVFESEQIRYEVGAYNYGDGTLCPPYELFPLCPYCGESGWCPAENARVQSLRARAARRAAVLRACAISLVLVIAVVVGVVIVNLAALR
jgi:DnaJ domain